ncbi:hypothetical protein [Paenibacillus aestuarii]|uniref:DUF4399 domain-containing protein n=1 Tax=Paenibacillus aestuarii TaxID=516965 RepID=A0ABW0KJR6_9BACL|nr:hypothetical protein [Paenibacillus aestuarii]
MKIKHIFAVAALTALLAGCGAAKTDSTVAATYKPTLDYQATVNGDTVVLNISTDLQLSLEHYDHERKQGEGHIHLFLDDGNKVIVTNKQYVLDHVPKGTHQVTLSLHNNDHTPYNVSKTISFEVK